MKSQSFATAQKIPGLRVGNTNVRFGWKADITTKTLTQEK